MHCLSQTNLLTEKQNFINKLLSSFVAQYRTFFAVRVPDDQFDKRFLMIKNWKKIHPKNIYLFLIKNCNLLIKVRNFHRILGSGHLTQSIQMLCLHLFSDLITCGISYRCIAFLNREAKPHK